MKREDIEKLVGGYATNTLTEEERRILFEAALSDQTLFEALAREETLKEVLEDPYCRGEIERALGQKPPGLVARLSGWMRRPQAWALAGALAATAAIAVVVIRADRTARAPIEVAQQRPVPAVPPRGEASSVRRFSASEPAKARQFIPPAATASKDAGRVAALEQLPASQPAPEVTTGLVANAPPQQFKPAEELGAGAKDKLDATTAMPAAKPLADARGSEQSHDRKGVVPAEAPVLKQEAQVPLDLRYKILVRGADGELSERDANSPLVPDARLRVVLAVNQEGYLSVFGARGVLFTTKALPGEHYNVDPAPQDRKLTAILSRRPLVAQPARRALLGDERAKETGDPNLRVVVEIDLNRP